MQRDLVGRLLPRGALDERDHPVEEGLAGIGGDAHADAVGEHLGAAGDRRAVAARLADDRRRLAGDGRLVDRGDALDDLAVAGDELAGLDQNHVALAQRRGGTCSSLPFTSLRAVVSWRIRRSVSAWALPRPSATASAKLAKSTVNQSQRVTETVNQSGAAPAGWRRRSRSQRRVVSTLPTSTTNMTGFFATSRGASFLRLSSAAARRMAGSKSESCLGLEGAMARTPFRGGRGSARRSGRATAPGRR